MPEITIPLVGPYNQRQQLNIGAGTGSVKDQRFINCVLNVANNFQTQTKSIYLEKRPGLSNYLQIDTGVANHFVYKATGGNGRFVVASGGTPNVNVFYCSASTDTNCGSVTYEVRSVTEGYIGGEHYFFIRANTGADYGGYYLPESAATKVTPTFTANRTSGNTVLASVSNFTGLFVGQLLSGTGIATGARIASMDIGASTVTMTLAATSGSGTSTTVTHERIAKIIDADFPLNIVGDFVLIDGYLSIAELDNRRIYTSDLNNPASWSASGYLTFGANADIPCGLFAYRGKMGCFGRSSLEFYSNQGNPSGSPFSVDEQLTSRVGCSQMTQTTRPSYAVVGDRVFWIGGQAGQGRAVYTLEGFSPTKVSSDGLDRNITSALSFSLSAFVMSGKTYVMLSQVAAVYRKFLICIDDKTEQEIETTASSIWRVCGGRVTDSVGETNNVVYVTDEVSDYLMQLRDDVYQDGGNAFSMIVQTTKVDLGTEALKTIDYVALMGSDIQTSGSATLEYSDDDYGTWTTAGTFDLTQINPRIHRCASYRGGRAWRLTHSANTAFRAQALKFVFKVGAH